jgi:hypothetical protein
MDTWIAVKALGVARQRVAGIGEPAARLEPDAVQTRHAAKRREVGDKIVLEVTGEPLVVVDAKVRPPSILSLAVWIEEEKGGVPAAEGRPDDPEEADEGHEGAIR